MYILWAYSKVWEATMLLSLSMYEHVERKDTESVVVVVHYVSYY